MAAVLAAVRRVVDPVQSRLIPAHVTLCRDEDLDGVQPDDVRVAAAGMDGLTLAFGPAERAGEHGILLPCVDGQADFHALRARLLGVAAPRERTAHLTLAHPRNPRAPGNDLLVARTLPVPLVATFTRVHWIEQAGDAPWQVRHTFPFRNDT